MTKLSMKNIYGFAAALLMGAALTAPAQAELSTAMTSKVKMYEQKLVALAKSPVLINAAKEANATAGGIPGMTNSKWLQLPDGDPLITALTTNSAAQMLKKFEGDNKGINKVILRDTDANIVATSTRPLLYNNKTKAPFVNGMKGAPWHADEVKPDTTTQVKGVHLAVPVKDGAKVIGVLHTSVIAE